MIRANCKSAYSSLPRRRQSSIFSKFRTSAPRLHRDRLCRVTYRMGLAITSLLLIVLLTGAAHASDQKLHAAPGDAYLIGSGDVLEISLWKNEDLRNEVAVLPDGTISFPLIGEIHASERTLAELKEQIREKIEKYVPDPVLSVSVKSVNSMHIFIIGRVNHPGRFVLNANITVLQALSMAGGFNPFAEKDDIRIFRQENGVTTIHLFNYDKVSRGKHLEENIMLKRGDVIVVP